MILTEVSAPPAEAIPVRAFAEHLRLGSGFADDGALDPALELYLRAAMAAVEARIGRALIARAFDWTLSRWRDPCGQGLPIGPVRGIERLAVVAADGTATETDPGLWTIVQDAQRARLVGRDGRTLPRIPRGGHAEIRIAAGYGAAWDAAPADLRQAVFLLAAQYFETRAEPAAGGGAMPFGVLVLLEAYRTARVGRGLA